MKKILFGLSFILGAFTLMNAQQIQVTNYSNNTVEYGNVKKGSDGSRIVKIKNTGNKPLIISDVKSSCGCTVPKWPTQPIAPGKTSEITVTYNTANQGKFSKTITIMSNDTKNPSLPLKVEGTVN